ncbi:TetR/AcrR family transcriptional regulator [Hwanghaeella sp.]|uniref:TetR/AcrR family transcriptional regulator n=1 Tax=Hwanghaeella sp. TaxID=2605943 RepID=UPI003CCB82F2
MTEQTNKKPIGRPKGEQVENAARRRKQLVEAAIDSIVELGMSATTLATVAKAAGLSQGVAVFYFKTKENLLVETLKHHYAEYDAFWKKAIDDAGSDPIDRLTALVFADIDSDLCTARNLALWNSYWGEAAARPRFAAICDDHDRTRYEVLTQLCREVSHLITGNIWTPVSVADALDSMTDGMWIRLHITPDFMDRRQGRRILASFMATVFPTEAARILRRAESYE